MTQAEIDRQRGRKFGYSECCIEAFIQGRSGIDVMEEYDLRHVEFQYHRKKFARVVVGTKTDIEVFGREVNYVPCKNCCERLARGER